MSAPDRFRVAIVITNLSASGAEQVALNTAQMFLRHGHQVDLILLEKVIQLPLPAALPVHCLSGQRAAWKAAGRIGVYWLAWRLKRLIKTLETSDSPFGLVLSQLPAADRVVAASRLRRNIWYCIHTHYSAELEGFRRHGRSIRAWRKHRQYQACYRDKSLITVSQGVQNDLREQLGLRAHRMQTIYNPFDFEQIRSLAAQDAPQLPDTAFILHASAFRPVKRHDVLLEAFSQLQSRIRLVLLTEPRPELDSLIDHYGVRDSVIVAGHQRNPYPFMRKAELTVLSSEREGLPTVLIESLVCGTPVVSTDCPSGPREILTGDLANWLAPVNEPAVLAKKIDQALQAAIDIDETQLEKFGASAVYQRYSRLVRAGQ